MAELHEGARSTPGAEARSDVWTVRLKPSSGDAIRRLAKQEDRKPSDMLRLLIQDGYRSRTERKAGR